jgi:hypothetical protein
VGWASRCPPADWTSLRQGSRFGTDLARSYGLFGRRSDCVGHLGRSFSGEVDGEASELLLDLKSSILVSLLSSLRPYGRFESFA